MKKKVINPNEIVEIIDTFRHIFKSSAHKIHYINVDEIELITPLVIYMDKVRQVEKKTPFKLECFNTRMGKTFLYFDREVEQNS